MSTKPAFASQFEFTPDNRAVVIGLIGKLDPVAVDELHPQIQELYRAGLRRFVFDLTNLEFAGSLGLRLLVGLQNQVRGEGAVTVCNPSDSVLSMLTLTKLTQVLPNYPTRDDALAATGG
ncbi:Anti-sigma-B factor antagonist [Gemmata sp. SH-PL17]|uniref:Anti-sigma factor antagonist n=1 Tax=Gemmata massiliana TaxID=1210884 RepID=A0A6P2DLF8_9BACT|nr:MULTISPECIES: STAS domain-containing protein [Gemmata]AMV22979.1 Anti-sigma-B factor antagonist [Gemmata sp. SH-PL17]VTS02562.1 anti-sigma factor antagonist : Anti-sigma-factor antagonist OS=Methanofollis liminatans DSM 4140 GN=Metli_1401 PE=4 SV=1: STAS_2 [Gemmata massiliana]